MALGPGKRPSLYVEPKWRIWHAFFILLFYFFLSLILAWFEPASGRYAGYITIAYLIEFICFFLLPLYIVCLAYKQPPQALGLQDKPLSQGLFRSIWWGVGLYVLNLLTATAVLVFLPDFPQETQQVMQIAQETTSLFDLALIVFCITVLVPVAEELFFRGFLFGALERRFGRWPAVLLSALVFAALHEWQVFLPIFVGGCGFSLMYAKYRDITMNMIAHATWNSIAIVLLFLL